MFTANPRLTPSAALGLAISFLLTAGAGAATTSTTFNLAINGGNNAWTADGFGLSTLTAFDSSNQPTSVVGKEFNGGFFITGETGAGSGQYRTLFRLQGGGNEDTEQGYNRLTPNNSELGETSLGPSNGEFIRKSDLVTTADGEFYIFSFDANEGGNKLISIDEFRIYTRPDTDGNLATFDDPSPLPDTIAEVRNGDLGTLRYSMDGVDANGAITTDNTVVIHAGGSGASDMFVFVPVSSLADDADSANIFVYANHGNLTLPGVTTDFAADAGFEEWSLPISAAQRPPISPIPEPASILLSICGFGLFLTRRKRT